MRSKEYYTIVSLVYCLVAVFLSFRYVELVDILGNIMSVLLLGIGGVILVSLLLKPCLDLSAIGRRFLVIALVYIQIKKLMDGDLRRHIFYRNLQGYRAIITDGDQPITKPIAILLVSLNCDVILACSQLDHCKSIMFEIQALFPNKSELIHASYMNLSDFNSIQSFSSLVLTSYDRLDFLVNAGSASSALSEQWLEGPLATILAHHLLEQSLLPLMLKPLENKHHNSTAARIIILVSPTALQGKLPPNLLQSPHVANTSILALNSSASPFCSFFSQLVGFCSTPESMLQLVQLLHTHELQVRADQHIADELSASLCRKQYRRLVTAAMDIGNVHAERSANPLHYWLSYSFKRSANEAAMVLLHTLLDNTYLPSSFINSAKHSYDLLDYSSFGLDVHKNIFHDQSLKYQDKAITTRREMPWGFFHYWWPRTTLFDSEVLNNGSTSNRKAIIREMSSILYDMSSQYVSPWLPVKQVKRDCTWTDFDIVEVLLQ